MAFAQDIGMNTLWYSSSSNDVPTAQNPASVVSGAVAVNTADGLMWVNVTGGGVAGDWELISGVGGGGGGDITAVVAGDGLSGGATSGSATVTLDLNELTAAAVADGDFIPIIDTNDSDGSRKEAVHDLATLFSGTGLTATSSVINVGGLTVTEFAAASLQLGTETFADNDTTLMTSAAIEDKIIAYGYGTGIINTGTAYRFPFYMADGTTIGDTITLNTVASVSPITWTPAPGGGEPVVTTLTLAATSVYINSTLNVRNIEIGASGNQNAVDIGESSRWFNDVYSEDFHMSRVVSSANRSVALTASATLAASYTLTFPAAAPAANQVLQTPSGSPYGTLVWATVTFSSFTVAGSTGTNQTITDSNTLTIAAGVGITTTGGATDTITIASTVVDTTYGIEWVDSSANALLRLNPSTGSNVDLTIEAGSNITLTPSGTTLAIAASSAHTLKSNGGLELQSGNLAIDLSHSSISGVLTVPNGGTGASNLGEGYVLLGNATGSLTALNVTAKGSLLVGDGTTDPIALAVGGTNDHILTIDSTEASGLKWAAGAGGGSGTVTSVAAGTGLSANPSPIVGAGTISLAAHNHESGTTAGGTLSATNAIGSGVLPVARGGTGYSYGTNDYSWAWGYRYFRPYHTDSADTDIFSIGSSTRPVRQIWIAKHSYIEGWSTGRWSMRIMNTAQNGSVRVMDVESGDSPRITWFGLGFNVKKDMNAGSGAIAIELQQGNADYANNNNTAGSDHYGLTPGILHNSYSGDKNTNARGFLGNASRPFKEATIRRIRFDAEDRTQITAFGLNASGTSDNPLQFEINTGSVGVYAGMFRHLTSPAWGIVFKIAAAGPQVGTSSNSVALRVTTDAGVQYGALVRSSSSQRYKNTIQNLASVTAEKVHNLIPRTFKWNLDGSSDFGLIAEEVYSVLPELVSIQNGVPQAVHYELLSVMLLKEIQRLNSRITVLESA